MTTRMVPYLILNGNAREAVAFYMQALDAQLVNSMTFGEMPGDPNHPLTEELKARIMHALIKVGEAELMFSDTLPGMEHTTGNNVTIAIVSSSADRSRQIFEGLAVGGTVTLPLQETPWSPAYGQVTDKYGVVWQINTEVNR